MHIWFEMNVGRATVSHNVKPNRYSSSTAAQQEARRDAGLTVINRDDHQRQESR